MIGQARILRIPRAPRWSSSPRRAFWTPWRSHKMLLRHASGEPAFGVEIRSERRQHARASHASGRDRIVPGIRPEINAERVLGDVQVGTSENPDR